MKKPRKKRTRPLPEAHDRHVIAQIEAQSALAREITQLAADLRACVAQIEQTLLDEEPGKVC